MSANIKINIVEPSPTPTPINPSNTIDPAVPNTGLFGNGIGTTEATAISISIVALLAIAAVIVAVLYRKHQKQGKVTKLVRTIDQCKTVIKSKKRITASLAALALLASAGTLATLLANTGKSNTNAVEGDTKNSLTVTESSEDLTIEVSDTPVFAVLPVELTVEEATEAGYTLTAYTEDTDLVSTTDDTKIIPMITVDEDELAALADNTYGLSLVEPEDKDSEVYTALSTDQSNPTIIKSIDDYSPTEAEDKTTIYYGFYITPDTPYGVYEGGDIYYEAEANRTDLAKVTFDGNGLYFKGNPEKTTNVARYETNVATQYTEAYSHTKNVDDTGKQDDMYPINTTETFVYNFANADKVNVKIVRSGSDSCGADADAYFSFWPGSHSDYTAEGNYSEGIKAFGNTTGKYVFGDYNNVQTEIDNTSSVTIAYHVGSGGSSRGCSSGYGYYAIITATDTDGDKVPLLGNELYTGSYLIPSSEEAHKFLGWSTEKGATMPTYTSAESIESGLDLNAEEETILYAVWQPIFQIIYNGNGADTVTNMDNVEQYTTDITSTAKQVDLLASNFTKAGHGFVGWSTDTEAWDHLTDDDEANNPIIYGPNQMITVDPSASTKLALYAIWAPAEIDTNGNPVSLQDWQGCSALTATTYNNGVLTVGKNTITALTDSRDGNIYTVARLADGNCWMIENLRLDNNATISTTNTNNPLTVDGSVSIKNNDGNTSAHLSPTTNSWCTNSDTECYDQSYLNADNTTFTTVSPTLVQDFSRSAHDYNTGNLNANISSYGNYYNWYSATAGNGTYSKSSGEVSGDICPAGWSLPVGNNNNTSGSFYYLNQQMGGSMSSQDSNNWRSFPNNFVYSGNWFNSSATTNRGNYGFYWSSTASNAYYVYSLEFFGYDLRPGTASHDKGSGYSARCLSLAQ